MLYVLVIFKDFKNYRKTIKVLISFDEDLFIKIIKAVKLNEEEVNVVVNVNQKEVGVTG